MVNCRAMKTEKTVNACEAVREAPFQVRARKVATDAKMVMVGEMVLAALEANAIFRSPATSRRRTDFQIKVGLGVWHFY